HNHHYSAISFQNVDELEIFGVVIFSIKAHK
ncbi:TPA: DNA polymerase V subunit UmuD, partial [Citrobacter freundii]